MKHLFTDAETKRGAHNRAEAQKADAKEKLIAYLETKGFHLISEYEGSHRNVIIKCVACGETRTRNVHSIYADGVICHRCKAEQFKNKRDALKAELIKQREETKEQRRRAKAKALDDRLSAPHVCKVCGCTYTIKDYMQSTGMWYARNSGFCSAKCRDEHAVKVKAEAAKRRGAHSEHHYDRAKRLGLPAEKGVTLKKIFIRDKGICQICQMVCDYSGDPQSDLYPSMDHIIPMNNDPNKQGGHTWANVQLAHRLCNSNKRDYVGEKWNNLKPVGKG